LRMGGLGSKTIRNPQPNKNTEIQLFLQKKNLTLGLCKLVST